MNSYTEVSPSGTGVHIFYKNDGNTHTEWNKKKPIDSIQHLEMYQTDRYFTVTGEMFGGYTSLNERSAAAGCIYRGYMQEDEQPESKPFKATMPTQPFTPLTDNEIIEKAHAQRKALNFLPFGAATQAIITVMKAVQIWHFAIFLHFGAAATAQRLTAFSDSQV